MRKLLTQYTRGVAFELIGVVLWRIHRRDGNEQVNVVWHDFQTFDFYVERRRFLVEQFFESCFYGTHKHRLAVFRAPHEMEMQVENTACVLTVSSFAHTSIRPECYNFVKQLTKGVRGGEGGIRPESRSLKRMKFFTRK